MLELAFYSTPEHIPLNALVWHPEGRRRTIAILTPGGYGGFSGPHDFRPTAAALNRAGMGFMMLNMRTAFGFIDPHLQDCIVDIDAGVQEARRLGYTDFIMLGCSLGGPRTTLYLANRTEQAIKAVGYINTIPSPYEEAQVRLNAEERARLDAALREAEQLVATGKGKTVIEYERWYGDGRGITMTARGFINVFGAPTMTSISLLMNAPQVRCPVGIIHGTADHISLPVNAQTLHDAFVNARSRELIWLQGSEHYWGPGPQAQLFGQQIGETLNKLDSKLASENG